MTDDTISDRKVVLRAFADAVGCSESTASLLRRGDRMPGRSLFKRIVDTYGLDPVEAMRYFCGSHKEFGAYLREKVFHVTEADLARDRANRAKS